MVDEKDTNSWNDTWGKIDWKTTNTSAEALIEIRKLMNQGADLNTKDKYGNTLMHYATAQKLSEVVYFLASYGADVNAQNNGGQSPLHLAPLHSDGCLDVLLFHGADVNAKDKNEQTPLHYATKHECHPYDVRHAKRLISYGADVNAKDKQGRTPLHIAADRPHSEDLAEVLISHGADVNAEDEAGRAPLFYACHHGKIELAKLLITHDAHANPELLEYASKILGDQFPYNEQVVAGLVLDAAEKQETETKKVDLKNRLSSLSVGERAPDMNLYTAVKNNAQNR